MSQLANGDGPQTSHELLLSWPPSQSQAQTHPFIPTIRSPSQTMGILTRSVAIYPEGPPLARLHSTIDRSILARIPRQPAGPASEPIPIPQFPPHSPHGRRKAGKTEAPRGTPIHQPSATAIAAMRERGMGVRLRSLRGPDTRPPRRHLISHLCEAAAQTPPWFFIWQMQPCSLYGSRCGM